MHFLKKKFAHHFYRGGIFHTTKNYSNYVKHLGTESQAKKIINIGAGGYNPIPGAINVDPYRLGPNSIKAFGENLPLKNESIDIALCAAVLEHVKNPQSIIKEIFRVLKKGGKIYIEMPFLQPFHAAPEDFSRLTISGLRFLLKDFREIDVGVAVGPGSTISWIVVEYVQIFFENKAVKQLAKNFAKVASFPLKYIDKFIIHKSSSSIIASGFYFYGEK